MDELYTIASNYPFLDDRNSPIQPGSKAWKELEQTDIFIWDEAPSSPKDQIYCVDRKLREIMDLPNVPFGGKIMIFAGDFRQILPIQQGLNGKEAISLSIKYSNIWKYCEQFKLTQNKRVDPEELYF